jgi:asparagine synthase (glutamine-hydrolysing)
MRSDRVCGIVGILSGNIQVDADVRTTDRMMSALSRRGPDESGFHKDNRVFLGHTRLSIIDLSGGKQPIYNEDNSKCIVFNGEIFNFTEIRSDLLRLGHLFKTNSDTEVILHSYEEWGVDCLEKFRGMFAFAIYDINTQILFIARDRLGVKPLFYSFFNGAFLFASEMKAIIEFKDFPKRMNEQALSSYFLLSYIPSPLTIYKDINKLPAGNYMIIDGRNHFIKQYWDISFIEEKQPEDYYISEIQKYLAESTSLRMISDVPLGAFLSGGIDSSVILALMSGLSSESIHTFCMGYGGNIGGFLDERQYADIVSKKFHSKHVQYEVNPNVEGILDEIAMSFDEPFADSSTIPSYYLYKMTRQKVKVALSGLGGDELFGGYERYLGFKLSHMYNRLPVFASQIINDAISNLPERKDGHYTVNHMKRFVRYANLPEGNRYFGYISNMTKERYLRLFKNNKVMREGYEYCEKLIVDRYNDNDADKPLNKVFYTDLKTYLPDDILTCTDRLSMWHSLEVRVPFLDHKFVELCAKIPTNLKIKYADKKYILKKAFKNEIPPEIIKHRKQGFDAPMTNWLNSDLSGLVDNLLSADFCQGDFFDKNEIHNIIRQHRGKLEINDKIIWSLIMFRRWNDIYMQ